MAMQYNLRMKVMLLREVVGMNPYGYSRKRLLKLKQEDKPWDIIAISLLRLPEFHNKPLTDRSCREHTELMRKQWKADDNRAFKRTGTDEEVTELKLLAEEVNELVETGAEPEEEPKKENVGAEIRNAAMESLAETRKRKAMEKDVEYDGDDLPASANGQSKASVLSFMQSKARSELEVRQRELDLRKEVLDLERKCLELQERRDEAQAAERRLLIDLLRNKQQ